jgi:hypothetical protein
VKYPKEKNNYGEFSNLRIRKGSALVLVTICMVVLSFLGVGMLTVAYGVRHEAIQLKNESISMLAAEAGYEKAVFWMSQQKDMLGAIYNQSSGVTGALNVPQGSCSYKVELFSFVGSRPIYRILSVGNSGTFTRTVDVLVVQALSGWDMGMCRIPTGSASTQAVNFSDSEVIDMPLHINDYKDSPDKIDIHIIGDPQFLQPISMGESRYAGGSGSDKYASVISTFDNGIYFDQPNNKVTDEDIVQDKIERFRDSTKSSYRFTPVASTSVTNRYAAVQLEFFVENGVGKIRITNNCTVKGKSGNTYDYKIKPGTNGSMYEKYNIYSFHYMKSNAETSGDRVTSLISDTYVTQSYNGVTSEPGGQIYVDGNVIIGGDKTEHDGDQLVKGRISIVATGNIWIADSINLDGPHDADGKPSDDNTNILGLVAQGVIKVVDPGLSSTSPGPPAAVTNLVYVPVGRYDESEGKWVTTYVKGKKVSVYQPAEVYYRYLPDPMVLEAAITVGGGGWGAENVGSRKEYNSPQDDLILRGTITEVIRGVVGLIGSDGYLKNYYFDDRVLEGILPGDIWLQGKFIPAPAGWHDYRVSQ